MSVRPDGVRSLYPSFSNYWRAAEPGRQPNDPHISMGSFGGVLGYSAIATLNFARLMKRQNLTERVSLHDQGAQAA